MWDGPPPMVIGLIGVEFFFTGVKPDILITCYCNLPDCSGNDYKCKTKNGCFSELQPDIPGLEESVREQKEDVDNGEHELNGTYGCLDLLPT